MYSLKQRRIYKIELADGTIRHLDPLAIRRRMHEKAHAEGWDLDLVFRDADPSSPPVQQELGYSRLAAMGRAAFLLPDLDEATGEGYSDADCVEAMGAFFEWEASLKKGSDPSPTGSPSGDGPPAGSAAAGGADPDRA